jgi:predicted TPR repeat methyltransferase
VRRAPAHVAALKGLEASLRRLKRNGEAAKIAVRRRAAEADVLRRVAEYAADEGLTAVAAQCYARVIRIDPADRYAVWGLAQALRRRGRLKEALRWYRRYQKLDPGEPESAHMVAALAKARVPGRAADAYVKSVFDGFAEEFDQRLVQDLHYQAPQLLFENVVRVVGTPHRTLAVLDLGCGTGLAGLRFRKIARRLEGIDLSPEMVRYARKRRVYDRLEVGEMTAALAKQTAQYDLIVAADVFCYVGDLEPVIGAAARALRSSGHLAFTVERRLKPGYAITRSGRYAHSPGYVRRCARDAGLSEVRGRKVILRYEFGEPVWGHVTVMRKP